jgi:hypothetical protein
MSLVSTMSGIAMTQTVELQAVLEVLEDLRGYSGVGADGNPLDTPSWNAALKAAEQVLLERVNGTV